MDELKIYVQAIESEKGIRPKVYYELIKIIEHKKESYCIVVDDNGKVTTLSNKYFKKIT